MFLNRVSPIVTVSDTPVDRCIRCDARMHSVCSVIDHADLSRLAGAAIHMQVEVGKAFVDEGEPATDFYSVSSGTVKLFKLLPDGRQQITGFASSGHFLGLAVSDTYAFSAQAIEPVRLCRFPRSKMIRLLDDFPALEHKLLETACGELAAAQEQMLLLGRKTARERVASFLASMLHDAPCGSGDRIHLPMSRAEIADYLGLTIETISRTLNRFKAESNIGIPSNDVIVILSRPWLEKLAAGAA